MSTALLLLSTLLAVYLLPSCYNLTRNIKDARGSGFRYFVLPMDQNGFLWMVTGIPLRPWLRRNIPSWMYDRMAMSIYGFEFSEKARMLGSPNGPSSVINDKTYVMASTGAYEVNTRDPEIVSEILRRPRDFMQLEVAELFAAKFGHNVITSNGDSWSRQRRVIASAINERISKTVFNESVQQTRGLLEEVIGNRSAGETNKMFDAMKKITIHVLSGAGMGASVSWNDDANEKPKPGFKMTYIEAIRNVINNMFGPILLPMWFLENYPTFLPGHAMFRTLGVAVKEFPTHTKDMLEMERQRSASSGSEARSNIMSQLLRASDEDNAEKKDIKALSEDEMMGNLFIFTAAGFDTTANTLSYAMILLARYPTWQNWLFEEIDHIMPKDDSTELDYAAIFPKATRVLACMMEVLRLFPPLVHIGKQPRTPQSITTSTGTYHFPGKSIIYINSVGVHLDPDVYRNVNLSPTDIESENDEHVFRPTRWINPKGSAHALFQPPKGSFVPWSAGPRVCPGQKMAQVEFTSIFLTLFRDHRIEAVPLRNTVDGREETQEQINDRLDKLMADSSPIMTLQMNGVYDVLPDDGKGVPVRLHKRN